MEGDRLSESGSSVVSSTDSTQPPAALRTAVIRFRDECERRFDQLLSLLQRHEEEAELRQAAEVRRLREELRRVSEERSVGRERLERLSADNARLTASLQRAAQQYEERMAVVADRQREALLARRAVSTWQRFVQHRRSSRQQQLEEQDNVEALRKAYDDVKAQLDQLRLEAEAPTRRCAALPNTQTINIYPASQIPSQAQHVPQQPQHVLQQPQNVPQQPQHVPQQSQPIPQQPQPIPLQPQHVPQQTQHISQHPQRISEQQQHGPQQAQHIAQQPQHVPQLPQHVFQQPQRVPQQPQHIPQQPLQSGSQPQSYYDAQYQQSYYQQPYPSPYYQHIPAPSYQPSVPQPAAEHPTGDLHAAAASHPPKLASPSSANSNKQRDLDGGHPRDFEVNRVTPPTSAPQTRNPGQPQPPVNQQASHQLPIPTPQSFNKTSATQTQISQNQTTQNERVINTDQPPTSAPSSYPFGSRNQTVVPPQRSSYSAQGRSLSSHGMENQLDALRDQSRSHLQQMQRNLRRFNELREESRGDNSSRPGSMDAQRSRVANRSTSTDGRQLPINSDEGDCSRAQHIHVCHCLGPKPLKENRTFVCPQCDPLHKTSYGHQPVKQLPSRGILRTKNT